MKPKYDKILGVVREDDLNGGIIAVDADFTGDVTIGDASTDTLIINSSISGSVLFDDGTEAAPSVAFASDTNTGIGRNADDELSLIAGGSEGLRIDGNELEVQPKMTLATGPIEFEEDSGAVTAMNMPVSSDSSDGDEMSMSLSIDSNPVLKIYGEADGTGGVKNTGMIGRMIPRVVTTTSDATAVINVATTDVYQLTAMAAATTFTLSGTAVDGQTIMIRFKDNGTTRALTFTGFTVIGVTLPTTTTVSKWHYVGIQYNSSASAWHVLAVGEEA